MILNKLTGKMAIKKRSKMIEKKKKLMHLILLLQKGNLLLLRKGILIQILKTTRRKDLMIQLMIEMFQMKIWIVTLNKWKKKSMHLILLLQKGNLSIQKLTKDQSQGKL
jgi:hypothetical protein